MKYRTKVVQIDAIQYQDAASFNAMLTAWGEPFEDAAMFHVEHSSLHLKTLEGLMLVNIGDYVIKGLVGEFYACKPTAFHMKYEQVT